MDNLKDYIRWMGDIPIQATGMRDADAMVLCGLSYFDLSPLFDGGKTPRLRDFFPVLKRGEAKVQITGSPENHLELMALAAASRRYGELTLSDYVDVLNQEPPVQFSCVCFHDDAGLSFLAYRGTDNSLAGWREDFMFSFTRTEAQELALAYALAHIRPDRRWYLGGHSKGGNLALYTACLLEGAQWDSVERVYLLDGPGLCPEVMDPARIERIDPKTRRIIPRFSVVGKLLEPKITDTRIVRATGFGVSQHSMLTWGIDHGELAEAQENDAMSLWINEKIRGWSDEISPENRALCVDELFDALSAGGAQTVNEIRFFGPDGVDAILKRLRESSDVTKHALTELPKYAVKTSFQNLYQKYIAKPAEPPSLPESPDQN